MRGSRAGLVTSRERKFLVLLSAMAAGLLFLPSALVSPEPARAYDVGSPVGKVPVHETMAKAALDLYGVQFFNNVEDGIRHEDGFDHIYGLNALPIMGSPILGTSGHFWASDLGPNEPTHNAHPFGDFPNALQKARELWSLALGSYANNDKALAYRYLGHVAHLVEDATVPAHAHDDQHAIGDDSYHSWMDAPGDPPANAKLEPGELDNLKLRGPLPIPDEEPDKLKWLLYSTFQIAEFFASDDYDGNPNANGYDGPAESRQAVQNELDSLALNVASPRTTNQLEDNDDGNNDADRDLSTIRQYSYLRGIRAVAALYRLFEQTVRQQVTLAVVIDRVEEDTKHDGTCPLPGCDPDFYAKVVVGGQEARNRGDQREEKVNVDNPGWAFGSTVGTSGSVPVRIEIWDNDGKYDDSGPIATQDGPFDFDDEQSDVDAHGDYGDPALELNVDIAKCLRREPGAISGDLEGVTNGSQSSACSTVVGALSEGGDAEDDPSSRVSFHVFASKSPPTADAGGPYTTDEGTDVTLDATGSSDPDNDIVTYAWDFDGDGCDDATGSKPSFTAVGQDGPKTVKLCVTDAVGLTAEDTATVTVNNVAPSISLGSNTPTGENTTVTVTGTISDPGWLDSLSGTISWGDGTATQALGGTVENVRPDATLPVSVSHTYGDNGTFTAQVCARDDKTTPCTTIALQIDNTRPTAMIDLSGAVDVNGTPTVIAHAGSAVGFSGRSTDPGSDDLTLTWAWGDGTAPSSTKRRVNPPNDDPAVSPSIQPRDETYAPSHTFAGACAYETMFAAVDDDGGSASQTAAVIIVGNGRPNQGAGYWKQQFRFHNSGKGPSNFDAARLRCYLRIVNYMSRVFDDRNDASTFLRAEDILETDQTSAILELFDQQLLAAWLNFANGAMEWNRLVDTNGDKRADTRFLDAIKAVETLRLDPNASRTQLDRQKAIVLSWTTLP